MLIGAQILGMALHTSSGSDVRRPNGANNGARALEAGVHLKIASARLGHASETFTASVYQHALPGMDREAAGTIAALFLGEEVTEAGVSGSVSTGDEKRTPG